MRGKERRAKLVIFSATETVQEPRLFFKIALSAIAAGYDVVFIGQHDTSEERQGVRIVPIHRPKGRIDRLLRTGWSVFVRAIGERGDVYHFSDPELIFLGLVLQFVTRRPVVYDLREYHSERIRQKFWIPRLLRPPLARAYELVEHVFLRRFAGVIAVNEDLADKRLSRRCHTVVVPNYAVPSIFARSASDAALRQQYIDRRVVIYVGGMSEDRGVLHAIRAIKRVRESAPNAQLVLVGPFFDMRFKACVRELIEDLDLLDGVELVEAIPYLDVPNYLSIAEVGLCLLQPTSPRYERTEPIKYFEYAAAGVPEVASDLIALRRLVEENQNGLLVDATSVSDVADAVLELLQNGDLAAEMSENGIRAIERKYNWETVFRRLDDLYRQVIR